MWLGEAADRRPIGDPPGCAARAWMPGSWVVLVLFRRGRDGRCRPRCECSSNLPHARARAH